jgi:hypothetical protein
MLHHKTKEKLIKLKESGLTADELRVQAAEAKAIPEDIDALIAELYSPDAQLPNLSAPAVPGESVPAATISPDANPVVTFDYENLKKGEFDRYNEHIASLPLHTMVDFQVFKVEPIIEDRYPGLPNTPRDLVGIRISNNKPIHTTRVSPKTALEMNAQLRNTNRFYLLKQ